MDYNIDIQLNIKFDYSIFEFIDIPKNVNIPKYGRMIYI